MAWTKRACGAGGRAGVGRIDRAERVVAPDLAEGPARVFESGDRPVADTRERRGGAVEVGQRRASDVAAAVAAVRSRVAPEDRRVVGHRRAPRTHGLAARKGRGGQHAPARWHGRTLPGGARYVLHRRAHPEPIQDVLRPRRSRGDLAVHEVVDTGERVGAEQLDDRIGHVGGVRGRAPFVAHDAQRPALGLRLRSGVEDLVREVSPRRPEQPGGPGDPETACPARGFECLGRGPLAGQLRATVRVRGRGRVGGRVSHAIVAIPGEHLVGRDDQELDPTGRTRRGEDPGRVAVATLGEVGFAGAAIDVGPGGGVHHDLRLVAVERGGHAVGRVEIQFRPGPGEGPARAGERRLAEGRDQGGPEPTGRARDRDAHQVAVRSRCPYWRS